MSIMTSVLLSVCSYVLLADNEYGISFDSDAKQPGPELHLAEGWEAGFLAGKYYRKRGT